MINIPIKSHDCMLFSVQIDSVLTYGPSVNPHLVIITPMDRRSTPT